MMDAVRPLVETLLQLERVVASLTSVQYSRPPEPLSDSSIGSHVRHCLDHVEALLSAAAGGTLDYDNRRRGTALESDPEASLQKLRSLEAQLAALGQESLSRNVMVRAPLTPSGLPIDVQSSLGRELAYVISHTTHHNAIIGFLVRAVGGRIPDRFGYAASTLAYMEEALCAR